MFITFEGGEGAGKTTLITSIHEHLKSLKKEVVLTREPGGSPLGEEIRSLLLKKKEGVHIGSHAELLLFLSARAEHVESLILPALHQGKIVLCDRFQDSTVAYQTVGRGLEEKEIKPLLLFAAFQLVPHITFYIDIDPKIGLQRASSVEKKEAASGEKDRIESMDLSFHNKVRSGFLEIAKKEPERVCVLNGTDSKEKVLEEALLFLDKKGMQ